TGRKKKARQAFVSEGNNRGHPLILEKCRSGVLNFVDSPHDTFWDGAPKIDLGDYRIAWIRWDDNSRNDSVRPILMDPGQARRDYLRACSNQSDFTSVRQTRVC